MNRATLFLLLIAALAASPGSACAQFAAPPTPGVSVAQAQTPVAAGAANITINTGPTSHPSMWEFLGVDKASKGLKSACVAVKRIPLIQNIGNTVVHPVARAAQLMPSPPGGALGAETSAPGPSGGAGSQGGATGQAGSGAGAAPGGPGASPPPPAIPGAPAPPPPAPGPAALLAKIKASKVANKSVISAIRQLERLDPREYPEIVASLLGKLDDPSEEVRYRALVALNNIAKPKRCTRSRATHGSCSCDACGRNWMTQSLLSQPMVVDRLSDLLLRGSVHSPERKSGARVSGAPKEYSNRIRRLALHMLEGSLRKPRIDGPRRAVPDPKYIGEGTDRGGDLPKAVAVTPQTGPPVRRISSRKMLDPEFTRAALRGDSAPYQQFARRVLQSLPAETSDGIQLALRSAAESFLSAENAPDPTRHDLAVIAQCYEVIKLCSSDNKKTGQLEIAFVLLTNSRLRLAIAGHEEHVQALAADADAFQRWNPDSIASREAAYSVVRYAGAIASQYGKEDPRYLTQFSEQATHFATQFPTEPAQAVPQLIAAAELCQSNGREVAARACFDALARFENDDRAAKALNARRKRLPVPAPRVASDEETAEGDAVTARPQPAERDVHQKAMTEEEFWKDDEDWKPEPTQPAKNDRGIVQAVSVTTPREPGRLRQVAFEQFDEIPPVSPFPAPTPDYLDSHISQDVGDGYAIDDRYAFERTTPTMDSFIAAMKAIDVSQQFEEVEGDCCLDTGFRNIATTRAESALFALDAARPTNLFRLRFDSAKDFASPDRAEYFWAAIGRGGPSLPERTVDYQELRLYSEKSLGSSSAFVEIPFRMLDPEVNSNTTGLGDINMGAKTILAEGNGFLLSTIFRSYFNSGLDRRGLGRGHFVLEPGILGNYQLGCDTWLHGEMKFLMPLGANADAAGEVLTFGAGFTHVLMAQPYHSGAGWNLGAIASLEFQGISLLDGRGTLPTGLTRATDETILYLHPGIRFMLGEQFDIGFSAAVPISDATLYERQFRTELRLSF